MRRLHKESSADAEGECAARRFHLEEGFDVLEELGQGSYSIVYRALDKALGREVVLKVLKRQKAISENDLLKALGIQFGMKVASPLPLDGLKTEFTEQVPIGLQAV